jgi:aspartyl-tRNA(Asn)/glutamyl-tRNA(Gln) amidotransferase subunit A
VFSFTSISSFHNTLLNGQTTCVEAVRHYIEKVRQYSHLNAWLTVYEKEALQRAAMLDSALDTSQPILPLYGVVVGLKDVISYKGHRCNYIGQAKLR